MQEPKKRGGSRKGAGRKAAGKPLVETITIKVDADLKEFASSQPEGESAFTRNLLADAAKGMVTPDAI